MRQFNPKIDYYYSPDSTPNLYLSEEQVEHALDKISQYGEEAEKVVRSLIRKVEELNRLEKNGIISNDECVLRANKIENEFVKKFGFWPYVTKTYKEFYNILNKKKGA